MGFFERVIEDALFVCLLSRIVPYLCWNVISSAVYSRKKKKYTSYPVTIALRLIKNIILSVYPGYSNNNNSNI